MTLSLGTAARSATDVVLDAVPGTVPAAVPAAASKRSAALTVDVRRALGGVLELVDEPGVRDILLQVTAGEGRLWVDRAGTLALIPNWRVPPEAVRQLACTLIAAGGRHLDELHPCADVRLGDGIRVHAVLDPVAVEGAVVSIRLPAARVLSFEELLHAGLCSSARGARIRQLIIDRKNFLVSGGTGSGKTTLLTALLELVPGTERILTIEDVAELRPRHPHRIALEARQANSEGAGEVTLDRLLREALRMRPDRIVLGECRGAELATLLTALNTGHDGGAGTLHANGIAEVGARLESLGLMAGLSAELLASQVASAVHCVIHVERRNGVHRIAGLGRPRVGESGRLCVDEIPW